jgi:hypothetical protein
MPFVLASAAPGVFNEAAPVTLKGSRAGREFWVSLGTRDADLARERARHLDREADALISLPDVVWPSTQSLKSRTSMNGRSRVWSRRFGIASWLTMKADAVGSSH